MYYNKKNEEERKREIKISTFALWYLKERRRRDEEEQEERVKRGRERWRGGRKRKRRGGGREEGEEQEEVQEWREEEKEQEEEEEEKEQEDDEEMTGKLTRARGCWRDVHVQLSASKLGRRHRAVYVEDEHEKRFEEHLNSRKRKAKGPNPMSCKKKRMKPNIERPSKKARMEMEDDAKKSE